MIVFSIIPFSSCVYDREFTYLNDQIITLNRRVTKLQGTIDTKLSSELDSRLKLIRSSQSEARVEVDQLKGEIKELSGRIEENEHIIKRAVERDLSDQDAMKASLTRLSEKVAELEMMVKRQQEYLGLELSVVREDLEQEKDAVDKEGTDVEQAAITEKKKSGELELYDISLASYREEKFEEAMDGFKDFLNKYPKSDYADNAQFWIGECYMSLKQHEEAILAYQEVIKKYPKGNKVPSALLRQAAAFLEIKDKTSSRLLLKKIIKKYPGSSEAEIARKKLKTLK